MGKTDFFQEERADNHGAEVEKASDKARQEVRVVAEELDSAESGRELIGRSTEEAPESRTDDEADCEA